MAGVGTFVKSVSFISKAAKTTEPATKNGDNSSDAIAETKTASVAAAADGPEENYLEISRKRRHQPCADGNSGTKVKRSGGRAAADAKRQDILPRSLSVPGGGKEGEGVKKLPKKNNMPPVDIAAIWSPEPYQKRRPTMSIDGGASDTIAAATSTTDETEKGGNVRFVLFSLFLLVVVWWWRWTSRGK